ncbi:hypothetical protein GCM10020370_20540 [Paenibacillus hodogayensis]
MGYCIIYVYKTYMDVRVVVTRIGGGSSEAVANKIPAYDVLYNGDSNTLRIALSDLIKGIKKPH